MMVVFSFFKVYRTKVRKEKSIDQGYLTSGLQRKVLKSGLLTKIVLLVAIA